MSNNPFNITTENLSEPVAEAVLVLLAAFAAKAQENAAFSGAQSLSETVEKLRALGA